MCPQIWSIPSPLSGLPPLCALRALRGSVHSSPPPSAFLRVLCGSPFVPFVLFVVFSDSCSPPLRSPRPLRFLSPSQIRNRQSEIQNAFPLGLFQNRRNPVYPPIATCLTSKIFTSKRPKKAQFFAPAPFYYIFSPPLSAFLRRSFPPSCPSCPSWFSPPRSSAFVCGSLPRGRNHKCFPLPSPVREPSSVQRCFCRRTRLPFPFGSAKCDKLVFQVRQSACFEGGCWHNEAFPTGLSRYRRLSHETLAMDFRKVPLESFFPGNFEPSLADFAKRREADSIDIPLSESRRRQRPRLGGSLRSWSPLALPKKGLASSHSNSRLSHRTSCRCCRGHRTGRREEPRLGQQCPLARA
jgi:hypothetical protein